MPYDFRRSRQSGSLPLRNVNVEADRHRPSMLLSTEVLIDVADRCAYASSMPTVEVQDEIIRTLESRPDAISMIDLLKQMRAANPQSTMAIRAAVLPLISVRRIELTPERKLRLAGPR